jgi:signal transduction histidine kinase
MLERLARRAGSGTNVALGTVMAALLAVDAVKIADSRGTWPFDAAVGLVLCAMALLLRGRSRAWAAVAGLAIFGLTAVAAQQWNLPPEPALGGALLGVIVLGAAAVRTLPPRPAATIAVSGAVVVAATEIVTHAVAFDHWNSFEILALFVLAKIVVWAGALAIGLWLRYLDRRDLQTLEAIRRDERLRLAREMHDVVAHHVTGIVVQAQAARFVGDTDPQPLLSALGSIESAGTETLAAIRELVGLLRDTDDAGGASAASEPISQLVERFARHGPAVDLRLPPELQAGGWPPQVASTVYRVVQEALTNIARHAPGASRVTVTVARDPRQVSVEVTDDAPAAAARHPRLGGGYGLVGMRERVEALGGKVGAGPRPGAGWAVRASLPVPAQAKL